MKNATLKYSRAFSTPYISGNRASTTGTAPRSPTQPMNTCSRQGKRNGSRLSTTATGRATSIRNAAMPSAGSAIAHQLARA